MPQIRGVTFAGLCITLIVVSLLVGTQLSSYLGDVRTTTVNLDSTEVITQVIVTRVSFIQTTTYYGPAFVSVSGEVSSVNVSPSVVQFEDLDCLPQPGCAISTIYANSTYYGGSSNNGSSYLFTGFSATIPNNQNYSVGIVFLGERIAVSVASNGQDNQLYSYSLSGNINGTGNLFIQCVPQTNDYPSLPQIACQT